MPTAARVVAALLLTIVGFAAAELVKPLLPEGMARGRMSEITAVIGLLTGWIVLGSRAGRGWVPAINNGLTAGVVMVFWALFVFSCRQMVIESLRRYYDGPMEALAGVFTWLYKYALYLVDTNVISTLIIGSIITGILTEMASRTWR